MKKIPLKALFASAASFLLIGLFANISFKKEYKPGDFVPEENAYFVEKIDDPTGLVKAHKFVTPTDNKYNSQKTRSLGTGLIGDIESVWTSYTGKGTTVAIIDDGFDYNHPEYTRTDGTSAILSTSRYYYASGNTAYYKSYSSDPTCIAEDWESDGNGGYEWASHGTNTSTTAAAPMNNGGGVGIAPDADILALKIDFSFVAIKAAIEYAISQNVDVINMSLGAYAESFTDGWGDSQSGSSSTATYLNNVCQSAYNAGIIVVAAAGNESTWHKSYPACNTKVIGVGALGDWDNKGNANELAEFTNYVSTSQTGEINVDILAPGYVYTATQSGTQSNITHTYDDTQGTSFSCPIVAGAACLWKQKYPSGTPDQFLSQLQSTADNIGGYANKMIKVSGWYSELTDVGPSNIQNGRLNVANLLDISEPYVSTVQSSLSISVGEKRQISLDTYNGTITYSSSNTSIATVSSTGLVEGKGAGNATITVTATKNGHTATATVSINVAAVVAATSIAFSPKSVTLTQGETYNAEETLTVTPANASRLFLFSSSDETVATVNEDTGLVSAVGTGTCTIEAIAGYGDGYDTLSVTVEAPTTPSSWTKVTSSSDLIDGDYLIVYGSGSLAFNGGLPTLDSTNNNISVSISSNTIAYNSTTEAAKFTINTISGGYSILSASGYYIGRSTANNGIDTSTSSPYVNTISISSGDATITGSGGRTLCFNTASDQQRFRYMSNGGAIQLYKASSGSAAPTPTVNSVTVSPTALSLDVYNNATGNLTASVSGTNSPAQTVTWSSSNTSIATVSNSGVVTAVAAGSCTITATSTIDTSKKGTCSVTVTNSTPKTLSSISISGYQTQFTIGDTFAFGGTVTAHYSDSSTANVTSSATFSGYDMSVAGNYTVTVSYTYGGTTKTATYQITVSTSGSTPVSNYFEIVFKTGSGDGTAMSTSTSETNYISSGGEYVSSISSVSSTYYAGSNGLKLGASSSNGSLTLNLEDEASVSSIVVNAKLYNSGKAATLSVNGQTSQSVSSSFTDYTFDINDSITQLSLQSSKYIWVSKVTVNTEDTSDKVVSSISASYSGGNVYVGNGLDTSKVSVTATYTDSIKYPNATLKTSDYQLSGFESTTAGTKVVTVTYTGSLSTSTTPLTTTFNVSVIADSVSNVTVTCSKSFHPGETIIKSDITVTLSWASGKSNTTTTDFTFANDGYRFTYDDAPSGGSNGIKQFIIVYNGNSYNVSVNVSRTAYQAVAASSATTLSSSQFSSSTVSKSSGTASNTAVTIGGTAFTVTTNAYIYTLSGTSYLSFGKTAGSINNTNAFDRDLASVTVSIKSGSRSDGILQISKDSNTWVTYSSSEIAKGGYHYFKFLYEGTSSSYSNITSISYTFMGQDNPTNVANYIMYEDTTNQCTTKLDLAVNKLNTMSNADKNTFWTSDDYVIATARERLQAWAAHEGKTLNYVGNNFVTSNLGSINVIVNNNATTIALVVISIVSVTLVGGYFFIREKKRQR